MAKTANTVGMATYQQIKHDIVFAELAPGMKLKLDDLRRRYEVSTSTIRETLNRLASEGFVDAQDQCGFFVPPVSRDDLIEVAQLRILLECHALRQSIQRGDTDWEGNLVAAHHKLHLKEQCMLAGDTSSREEWKRYDWEFHLALIQACGSRNLLLLHSIVYDKYLRYQMLLLTYRGRDGVDEHRSVLDAALRRDADAAVKALHAHIQIGLDDTLSVFKNAA